MFVSEVSGTLIGNCLPHDERPFGPFRFGFDPWACKRLKFIVDLAVAHWGLWRLHCLDDCRWDAQRAVVVVVSQEMC